MDRLLAEGGHDLILSIGQVVPHEVIGMANYNKNIFVGTGGPEGINKSHFIGAVYGMERMMGRADTPVRRILNYASDHFSPAPADRLRADGGRPRRRRRAAACAACSSATTSSASSGRRRCRCKVNFEMLDEPLQKVVVYLDPEEFKSTWLGNKSIYRTRMAIADGGELIVLAPGAEGVRRGRGDRPADPQVRLRGHAARCWQAVQDERGPARATSARRRT